MEYTFGCDFSKWFIGRAATGVWHVFPPVLRASEDGFVIDVINAMKVQQFDSGAQALAAFNRGHK